MMVDIVVVYFMRNDLLPDMMYLLSKELVFDGYRRAMSAALESMKKRSKSQAEKMMTQTTQH